MNCRNCNSNSLLNLFSLGKLAYTGKFPKSVKQNIKKEEINIVICKSCDLVQLGKNFNLKYLYGPDYGYRTGINLTMKNHVNLLTKKISKIVNLKKGDAVLDIASNDGTLLNNYNNKIITFGVDPIIKKYKSFYKKINYTVADFFNYKKIKKKYKKNFKIITALSVFYDLKKPNSFLSNIEKLLDDKGVAIIEIADLHSIIKYKMFDTICHEHLEYYSSSVLKKMFEKNKLKLIDINENKINGSSKQYYICKKYSKFKIKKEKIKNILRNENKLKLNKKKTFLKFKSEINRLKKELLNNLKNIKKKKQIIHGYGASTKGNVLLQYFDIDKKYIDYVAERNPKKYNSYTPGTKVKIISENESRSKIPNYYLVLPWHFKNEILKREKKIIKQGTKFIFPLPRLKIV